MSALSRGLAGTVDDPSPDAHQDFLGLQGGLRLSRTFSSGADTSLRLDARRETNTFRGGFFSQNTEWWQASLSWDGTLPLGHHWLSGSASVGLSFAESGNPGAALGSHLRHRGPGRVAARERLELSLVPSVRLDQAGPFIGVSPKLGVSWALPAGVTLQANVGQSYRVPSFLELYIPSGTQLANPDLQPERGVFVDAGAGIAGAPGMFRVAGFAAQYENLITYEYQPPLPTKPQNLRGHGPRASRPRGGFSRAGWMELAEATDCSSPRTSAPSRPSTSRRFPPPAPPGDAAPRVGPEWFRVHATMRGQSLVWLNRSNTQSIAGGCSSTLDSTCGCSAARGGALVERHQPGRRPDP